MKKTKMEKGITLVALIITIIVLLILAVVTINAVKGDGIIQKAESATAIYNQAATNEQAMLDSYVGKMDEFSQVTWKKTSTGDLAVGSTVVTSTGENFYVIGFKDNNETVILVAKNNLKADWSAQDTTEAKNTCAFSTLENLSFTSGEDLNKNSTVIADTTSAVYKAMQYGKTLGLTTGRLMTSEEAEKLDTTQYSDILYGTNGKSSTTNLAYWLGSAYSVNQVSIVTFSGGGLINGNDYNISNSYAIRPVVEIPVSNIKVM